MLEGLIHGQNLGNNHFEPGWLEYLHDAATGHTRLGESARRSSEHGAPLLARLGPKGDFKDSPTEMWDRIHAMLATWVQATINRKGNPQ